MNMNDCWLWAGLMTRRPNGDEGYGFIPTFINGKKSSLFAHRVVYESVKGQIPEGSVIDHLCRVTRCVNPDHLEAVTQGVNVARGIGALADKVRQTHCKHGHEFTPENTGYNANGTRKCKKCTSIRVTRIKKLKRTK